MTHPTERRNLTYCPSPFAEATEAWMLREGWYGVREEIGLVLQKGTAVVERSTVAYPWSVVGQWQLDHLNVRKCSYNPVLWLEIRVSGDSGWVRVAMPRDWNGQIMWYFNRLLHERMSFDAGRLPILPPRFEALDVQDAVEATYAREEQREAVPA